MYAAANAGLPVIKALLVAGADTALRDSTGQTALDYLEGRGPVPANPVLTGADLAMARSLLTPHGR
nr:ankyrin repeat domain-containing protein [Nitrospirillum iridis]